MICEKATSKLPRACSKDDLIRFRQTTHPPGIARRVANDLAVRVGDNNTGRDPDTNGEIRRNFRAAHIPRKSEPGVYCPLCRVFLGDRVTEVGKYFAPNALPYDPAELGDDGTGSPAVCIDNRLQFLGVRSQIATGRSQLGAERGDLPALGRSRRTLGWRIIPLGDRPVHRPGAPNAAHLGCELVAATGNRNDQARPFRIKLDLPAQTHDQHIDTTVVRLGIASGRYLQKLIPGQHPPGSLREFPQEFEFAACETNLPPSLVREAMARKVQAVIGKVQHRSGLFRFGRGDQ
jgi:hypothetical protein